MDLEKLYSQWVERVCTFLEDTGPTLGPGGRHCATFQSKPILDGSDHIVILGYNPHEDWGFDGVDVNRFYTGNPSFYTPERLTWKVWRRFYNAMKYVSFTRPLEDGNFVFFNAVYFGSKDVADLKRINGINSAIDMCLDFTSELIHGILCPKAIVCLSVNECFNLIDNKFCFRQKEIFRPSHIYCGEKIISTRSVVRGLWNDIPVYGIPHPSGRISNDDWGAIATFLKGELSSIYQ